MYLWLDIRVGIIHKFVCKAIISHTHFRNINVLRLLRFVLHAISLSHSLSISLCLSLFICCCLYFTYCIICIFLAALIKVGQQQVQFMFVAAR